MRINVYDVTDFCASFEQNISVFLSRLGVALVFEVRVSEITVAGMEAVGIERNDASSIEKEEDSNYLIDGNDILESNDRYCCR